VANVKKYDISGKELGTVEIDESLVDASVNAQLVKDYIVAIRENARQWSANTKGRTEVNRTGKKPHPQKGTGKARQGSLAAPQFKGGGIVFGPKPKFDQHVRINKKERQKAVKALLSERIKASTLYVVEVAGLEAPQTKKAEALLSAMGIKGQKTLFLGQSFNGNEREDAKYKQCELLVKSMRNLPKVSFMPASSISGYDLIHSNNIVVMESALDEVLTLLGRAK